MIRVAVIIFFYTVLSLGLKAQIALPRISPASQIKQTVGLTDFEVSYSRPGRRGRELLGELIPYDEVWRLGANESTKIKVSQDILVNGDSLASGTYAMLAIPRKDAFTIIFNSDTTLWGDEEVVYQESEDVLRVESPLYHEDFLVENFRIDFQNLRHDRGQLVLAWGNFRVALDLTVFTDDYVMRDIEKQMWTNPTSETYYQSARYLQEQGKDQEDALRYLDKAEILGGPSLYIYRIRSLVLAQQERFEEAIEAAEASKLLAQEEGNTEFVRLNRRAIRLWRRIVKD